MDRTTVIDFFEEVETAEEITNGNGDYLLDAKGNQPNLPENCFSCSSATSIDILNIF